MRKELIADMLFCIKTKTAEIKSIFGDLLQEDRFGQLVEYIKSRNINTPTFLRMCQIDYIAPGDAAKTSLRENTIDYHISHTVYEHIPLNKIKDILEEGNRIIGCDGLFINSIDYGDHFSYMDKNISIINFLQYTEGEWERYAGNRYMYMNRARHDEFIEVFKGVGHECMEIEKYEDKRVENILERKEIKLDKRFERKDKSIIRISSAWFITKDKNGGKKKGT